MKDNHQYFRTKIDFSFNHFYVQPVILALLIFTAFQQSFIIHKL